MQNLVTSQTEATKVTADAAKQLVELHKAIQSQNNKVIIRWHFEIILQSVLKLEIAD